MLMGEGEYEPGGSITTVYSILCLKEMKDASWAAATIFLGGLADHLGFILRGWIG
jgi:hypothetical protein